MHPVNLIAKAIPKEKLPQEPIEGVCCVTGQTCLTLPRTLAIGKAFTNLDLLLAPESPRIGVEAYAALKYKWERMSCWLCDGAEFKRFDIKSDRPLLRSMVLNGVDRSLWSGYITTSYHKHGALRAVVNIQRFGTWLFETDRVDCSDRGKVNNWYRCLNEALRGGIGRSIIESLDCPPFVLGKIGVSRWLSFEQWAKPKYQSPLYQFLCYLLPSQEELKREA
jgi:hypothetical protein